MTISTTMLIVFACVIAFGLVYNGARIALSERGNELASLRVLGFTQREVGVLLLRGTGPLDPVGHTLGLPAGLGGLRRDRPSRRIGVVPHAPGDHREDVWPGFSDSGGVGFSVGPFGAPEDQTPGSDRGAEDQGVKKNSHRKGAKDRKVNEIHEDFEKDIWGGGTVLLVTALIVWIWWSKPVPVDLVQVQKGC